MIRPKEYGIRDILNISLVLLLAIFSVVGYMPQNTFNLEPITMMIFFSLLTINIKNIFINFKLYHKIFIIIMILLMYYMVVYLLGLNEHTIYLDIYEFILSFAMLITMMSIDINTQSKNIILLSFAYLVIAASFITIYYVNGSIWISSENYIGGTSLYKITKNAFSPLLAYSILILIYKYIYEIRNIRYLFAALLGFIPLLSMQARSNIGVVLIVLLVMLIFRSKELKKNIIRAIILISVLFCISTIAIGHFTQYTVSFLKLNSQYIGNSNYLDVLFSGRLSNIQYAFNLFCANPLFGTFFDDKYVALSAFGSVHSVWLRALLYGGILYFIVFLSLVIEIVSLIKELYNKQPIVYFLLLGGLVISFLEPIAPFGPGTTYLMYWMIMGFYLGEVIPSNVKAPVEA